LNETTLVPFSVESAGHVYQDRNQLVERVVARFDGFTKEFYVADHGQRAAVLALRDAHVLLVRQYRLLVNAVACEIPGGRVDEGESPETAAARECLEETGFQCSHLRLLLGFHPSLEITKNYTFIFYSKDVKQIDTRNSERFVWFPLVRCLEMVFSKEIQDSLTITALLAFNHLQSAI